MAPYFAQNKVVAVNLSRLDQQKLRDAGIADSNGKFVSQAEFTTKFKTLLGTKPASYINVFTALKGLGADQLTINDYMRDNLMIGSENSDASTFDSTPTDATFNNQITGLESTKNLIDSKPI